VVVQLTRLQIGQMAVLAVQLPMLTLVIKLASLEVLDKVEIRGR
jgi:hypothetical protein